MDEQRRSESDDMLSELADMLNDQISEDSEIDKEENENYNTLINEISNEIATLKEVKESNIQESVSHEKSRVFGDTTHEYQNKKFAQQNLGERCKSDIRESNTNI